jgi:hypothetical protein
VALDGRPLTSSRAALITLLIVDRPLCLDCVAKRANLSVPRVEEYLDIIRRSLTVYHEAYDRCRACGNSAKVVSLDRPPL